ncbi:Na(+)/H(+) exchange regulatory cofactor NHE-RF1 [Merluccius polli]|uniref:Na(+)/H(+) exchange regulatory cofactor NHE-RF1 n=1 Tax=Merluccius polli TaxID=89951 RepID=A0AA47NXH3_MERPO|nr:Na(+)/H(+) exchange regulatory cofactor NHE-RF1 [Merluccius polli]
MEARCSRMRHCGGSRNNLTPPTGPKHRERRLYTTQDFPSRKEASAALRPRLCHMAKGANGYGFNLHSEKTKPGQFIRAVDDHSPAQRSGLLPRDKILQVNGVSVAGMQHAEVVAVIKAGGEETTMLVVDPEAEAYFTSCNVLPTEEHLTGPLPERGSRVSMDEVNSRTAADPSPSSYGSSSNAAPPSVAPAVTIEAVPEPAGDSSLSLSLAQVKERAHQKRSAKKAPTMDWSKRNELFSNL